MKNVTFRSKYSLLLFILLSIFYLVNQQRNYQDLRYLGKMFFWLILPIFFISVIAVFIKENAYISWRKFTKMFLIFAVISILITPTSGTSAGSFGMDIYAIDKELVTILLSGLYAVISLPLIIYKSFKNN